MASRPPFAGARALVTGASSGIGADVARQLADVGCAVAITARRADRLDALAVELRTRGAAAVHVIVEDLASREGAARVAAAASTALGGVDVLVNNAGFAVPGLTERAPLDRTLAMIDVNVVAPVVLTRALLPAMLEARRGWILNVSSVAGIGPAPYQAGYSGTKAFLLHWSESFREEVRDRGVAVTALCPGITDTEFFEAAGYRGTNRFLRWKMSSARVARAGLRALAKGRCRVVTGWQNRALVFTMRIAPRWMIQGLAARLMRRRPEPR
jgi:short-subunit dehydrogenase